MITHTCFIPFNLGQSKVLEINIASVKRRKHTVFDVHLLTLSAAIQLFNTIRTLLMYSYQIISIIQQILKILSYKEVKIRLKYRQTVSFSCGLLSGLQCSF